jgi:hypothetical protein
MHMFIVYYTLMTYKISSEEKAPEEERLVYDTDESF